METSREQRAEGKSRRRARLRDGLCTRCDEPAAPGRTYCPEHLKDIKKHATSFRERRRLAPARRLGLKTGPSSAIGRQLGEPILAELRAACLAGLLKVADPEDRMEALDHILKGFVVDAAMATALFPKAKGPA